MTEFSDHFTKMAASIEKNSEEDFGGAFLIVLPPDAGNESPLIIKGLVTGLVDSAAMCALIQAKIQDAINDMQNRDVSGFGGRMR